MAKSGAYKVMPDIPDALLKQYLGQAEIAVDTELHGLQLHRDRVCLIQLCDRKGDVCLVRPEGDKAPPNLATLLKSKDTLKVFHYALTDIAFLKTSLGVMPAPIYCTKVASKLVRTYTDKHSLKYLVAEFLGKELDKAQQSTNWSADKLSPRQLQYAADDVLYLLKVYDALEEMVAARGPMPAGKTLAQLNQAAQAFLPTLADLIISGYGDRDQGWESSLFSH